MGEDLTLHELMHKSGEAGVEARFIYRPNHVIIRAGEVVDGFYVVYNGAVKLVPPRGGSKRPVHDTIVTDESMRPPIIEIIGARSFFTRQPVLFNHVAVNRVSAWKVDSRVLIDRFNDRTVGPIARCLISASDISKSLQEYMGKRLGVDPKQGFTPLQFDKIYGAFPEYDKILLEAVQSLLRKRNVVADDPSIVFTPQNPEYASYQVSKK
jgi:hypothetical protein